MYLPIQISMSKIVPKNPTVQLCVNVFFFSRCLTVLRGTAAQAVAGRGRKIRHIMKRQRKIFYLRKLGEDQPFLGQFQTLQFIQIHKDFYCVVVIAVFRNLLERDKSKNSCQQFSHLFSRFLSFPPFFLQSLFSLSSIRPTKGTEKQI